MTVTVETERRALRFAIRAYGVTVGALMALQYRLIRPFVRFRVVRRAADDGPCIYASWHENVSLVLLQSYRPPSGGELAEPQVWLQHPVWFMSPVHRLLGHVGIDEFILGSTGHDGQAAAAELTGRLRAGASTTIFPDGPAGPARVLHKGVLHLAASSGLPIVPLGYSVRRCPRVGGWDRKHWPVWGSAVNVTFGEPIHVDPAAIDAAGERLSQALSAAGR